MSETREDVITPFRKGGTIPTELFNLVVGQRIGGGTFRTVFEFLPNEAFVLKFETESHSFSNVTEWDMWHNLADHKTLAKWMAPVTNISPCGTILMQRRTRPVSLEHMPKKIPRIFTDTKIENWGMLDGRVVCHDYGNHSLYSGGTFGQLVKAHWWHES